MRLAPKKKSSFVNETPRDEINKKCNPYSPPSVVDTNLPISLSPPPPSETLGRLQFAYGVLFLCGIFFACIVWPFLLSPLGIFDARYHFKNRDVVLSIAGFALALSGYFVWETGSVTHAVAVSLWHTVTSFKVFLSSIMLAG